MREWGLSVKKVVKAFQPAIIVDLGCGDEGAAALKLKVRRSAPRCPDATRPSSHTDCSAGQHIILTTGDFIGGAFRVGTKTLPCFRSPQILPLGEVVHSAAGFAGRRITLIAHRAALSP